MKSPHLPSFSRFAELARDHDLVPLYRRLLSDSLTPVSAFRLLDDGESSACLFESVIGGEKVGRYSFIALHPNSRIVARGREVQLGPLGNEAIVHAEDPLALLWETVSGKRVATVPELPPLTGGAIGYAGYDVVRYVENLPHAPVDDRGLPDLDFSLFDSLVVFDSVTKSLFVITHVHCDQFESLEAAYADGVQRLDRVVERLQKPVERLPVIDFVDEELPHLTPQSNFTKQEFEEAVKKCVEYIRAGDIFQVVISQRWTLPNLCDPFEVYRTLRVINPSPFMFYVRTPSVTLVGSSPEVMCRVMGGDGDGTPLGGNATARKNRQGGSAVGHRIAGRSQGARRTRDVGRFGPQ